MAKRVWNQISSIKKFQNVRFGGTFSDLNKEHNNFHNILNKSSAQNYSSKLIKVRSISAPPSKTLSQTEKPTTNINRSNIQSNIQNEIKENARCSFLSLSEVLQQKGLRKLATNDMNDGRMKLLNQLKSKKLLNIKRLDNEGKLKHPINQENNNSKSTLCSTQSSMNYIKTPSTISNLHGFSKTQCVKNYSTGRKPNVVKSKVSNKFCLEESKLKKNQGNIKEDVKNNYFIADKHMNLTSHKETTKNKIPEKSITLKTLDATKIINTNNTNQTDFENNKVEVPFSSYSEKLKTSKITDNESMLCDPCLRSAREKCLSIQEKSKAYSSRSIHTNEPNKINNTKFKSKIPVLVATNEKYKNEHQKFLNLNVAKNFGFLDNPKDAIKDNEKPVNLDGIKIGKNKKSCNNINMISCSDSIEKSDNITKSKHHQPVVYHKLKRKKINSRLQNHDTKKYSTKSFHQALINVDFIQRLFCPKEIFRFISNKEYNQQLKYFKNRTETPYKASTDYSYLKKGPKIDDYLQPKNPILGSKPLSATDISLQVSPLNPKVEDTCLRKKYNIRFDGTYTCDTFSKIGKNHLLKQKQVENVIRNCDKILNLEESNKTKLKPNSDLICTSESVKCEEMCATKNENVLGSPTECEKIDICNFVHNSVKPPICPPINTTYNINTPEISSRCNKFAKDRKSILSSMYQTVYDYFKARPNCPAPDDWKKKKLLIKAYKAADAAGLMLCDHCGRKVNSVCDFQLVKIKERSLFDLFKKKINLDKVEGATT